MASSGVVRIKAVGRPAAQPDIAALIRAEAVEAMASAGPFDRTSFEATERARIEERNRQLAAENKQAEEQRRRRVGR